MGVIEGSILYGFIAIVSTVAYIEDGTAIDWLVSALAGIIWPFTMSVGLMKKIVVWMRK